MDRTGADFYNVIEKMRVKLKSNAVPLQIPIGAEEHFKGIVDLIHMKAYTWDEASQGQTVIEIPVPADLESKALEYRKYMIEAIADADEALMEKYLNEEHITPEEIEAAVRKATLSLTINPVVCGTAFKNKGVQSLLDSVVKYLPSPVDVDAVTGTVPNEPEKTLQRKPNSKEPFAALAFKIATDPYVGKLTFIRVYSGELEAGSYVVNTSTGKKERIGRLLQMHANSKEDIKVVRDGDIAAAVGIK
jgi:elongation factor G